MKFFKRFLIGVMVAISLPLIIALFVKKEYHVERQIEINKPKNEVFEYIKHLKNQEVYSPWAKRDPKMRRNYTGQDGTVGFISAWDSDNEEVGKGEQEIVAIDEGNRMDLELRFEVPFQATEPAYFITKDSGEGTLVIWGFSGHMDYPSNLLIPILNFEEMIGQDLEDGLKNLKTVLESN